MLHYQNQNSMAALGYGCNDRTQLNFPLFQVFILDSLANYNPVDDREAKSICERITPRLAHANAAVVLSAVKVSRSTLHNISQGRIWGRGEGVKDPSPVEKLPRSAPDVIQVYAEVIFQFILMHAQQILIDSKWIDTIDNIHTYILLHKHLTISCITHQNTDTTTNTYNHSGINTQKREYM